MIAKYQQQFPLLRAHRNPNNIGIIGNITKVASELACGDFVWLLGDDDALTSGAVQRVLHRLHQSPEVDLVAFNVAYESAASRPSVAESFGGVLPKSGRTLRKSATDAVLPFEQLFEGPCADLTAMYSLAMRRRLWTEHYPAASTLTPFSSVESTIHTPSS